MRMRRGHSTASGGQVFGHCNRTWVVPTGHACLRQERCGSSEQGLHSEGVGKFLSRCAAVSSNVADHTTAPLLTGLVRSDLI